jgi:hypothetical protein
MRTVQSSRRPGRTAAALVAAALASGASLRPALADPAAPAPPAGSAPSAADLAEIQRALGADRAAAPPPPPPPPAIELPSAARQVIAPLNPSLSLIGDFALAAFSRDTNLQAGGHDPTETGFNLQALEISLGADVDPYFKFVSHLVMTSGGFEIEEAYATTTALPGSLELRAGEFLTRFGRLNATHPHQWDFVDQPFVLSKMLGGDGNRGLGVELSWLSPLPWYLEVVLSETMATGACCARSFYGDEPQPVHGPQDMETMLAIKQFHALSDDWSLATGLSGAIGPDPATPHAIGTTIVGADAYLKYRPITRESFTIVSLQAEAIARRRETPAGPLADEGLYAQLLWRFAQRWTTGARYEIGNGPSGDPLDPAWAGERQRVSADVTFFPTEFSRLRLQGSVDLPAWLPYPIFAGFLAAEFAIGAHGAHSF